MIWEMELTLLCSQTFQNGSVCPSFIHTVFFFTPLIKKPISPQSFSSFLLILIKNHCQQVTTDVLSYFRIWMYTCILLPWFLVFLEILIWKWPCTWQVVSKIWAQKMTAVSEGRVWAEHKRERNEHSWGGALGDPPLLCVTHAVGGEATDPKVNRKHWESPLTLKFWKIKDID